jgi:dethiobiotin synthetase
MTKLFFITGTDTNVGKTLVSAALLKTLNELGKTTVAMKPVASGCEVKEIDGKKLLCNADALLLQKNASIHLPYQTVNPFAFAPAIAPHIAAQEVNVEINAALLHKHAQQVLNVNADVTIIEGAGGYLVPLNNEETLADFAKALDGDVILVVAIRLGCINHALLTAKAIEQDGLKIATWVANFCETQESESYERQQQIIASIKNVIKAPMLAAIPILSSTSDSQKIVEICQLFQQKIQQEKLLTMLSSNMLANNMFSNK